MNFIFQKSQNVYWTANEDQLIPQKAKHIDLQIIPIYLVKINFILSFSKTMKVILS